MADIKLFIAGVIAGVLAGILGTVAYYNIPPLDGKLHVIRYDSCWYVRCPVSHGLQIRYHNPNTNEKFEVQWGLWAAPRTFKDDDPYISYKIGRMYYYDVEIHGERF